MNVTTALPVRKGFNERAGASRNQSVSRKEVTHMKASFNVAENGGGSFRLLAILRWGMVVIFVSFCMQKFTLQSAPGILQFISNYPFFLWLSFFCFKGGTYFLGVFEFS